MDALLWRDFETGRALWKDIGYEQLEGESLLWNFENLRDILLSTGVPNKSPMKPEMLLEMKSYILALETENQELA